MLFYWPNAAGRPTGKIPPNLPGNARLKFEVSLKDSAAATDSFIFDHENIDILHKLGVAVVVQPTRKLLTTGFLKPDNAIKQAVDDYNMVMMRFFLIGADGTEKTVARLPALIGCLNLCQLI